MRFLFIPILLSCLVLGISCSSPKDQAYFEELNEQLRQEFAPDKRVALWDLRWEEGTIKGETNLKGAYEKLLILLESKGVEVRDSVIVLPSQELGNKTYALITLSVANIRSDPRHSAELATQALMGTPLKVLKSQGSWYLVQTPEGYISWVDAAGVQVLSGEDLLDWEKRPKLVSTEMLGYIYENDEEAEPMSDITAGNIVALVAETEFSYEVELPDGRRGFVPKNTMLYFEEWIASRELSDDNLIRTAKNMMGVPYLWGGTSPKGVDCSGFTKTIYFLNGMIIPRDASQQVREGEEIDTDKNWDKLEVGDLLFFGSPATSDQSERVIHVGMWIGNESFIHSRGRVRISSFNPEDPNYDEYELNRYLRTKRIRNQQSENLWPVNLLIQ
jgi:gamma-D-glutamyl-L-lysine dipeptidyl-peptidase